VASQSLPVPAAQAHRQSRARVLLEAPSLPLRAALIALVAIVILFRWLHLIVSLQVASTNRQIQVSTDELGRQERANAALLCSVAEAASPRSLAERARALGYRPQPPVYVPSGEPLSSKGNSSTGSALPPRAEQVLLEILRPAALRSATGSGPTPVPEAQASP
jgi:hypothetical protein